MKMSIVNIAIYLSLSVLLSACAVSNPVVLKSISDNVYILDKKRVSRFQLMVTPLTTHLAPIPC